MVICFDFLVDCVSAIAFENRVGECDEHIFQLILVPSLVCIDLLGKRIVAYPLAYRYHFLLEQVVIFVVGLIDAHLVILFCRLVLVYVHHVFAFSLLSDKLHHVLSKVTHCYFK